MKRAPRNPEPTKRWLAFLRNHREAIAAMDFFTVPTIAFRVLYGFFVMSLPHVARYRFNDCERRILFDSSRPAANFAATVLRPTGRQQTVPESAALLRAPALSV